MDHYVVSARKYRPSTFDTVIGQKPLTAALKHSIATDKLAHAYLFCGSRGVGKTSCARIFAKTINCMHRTATGEACNECESCRAFNENRSLNIIELDAASHNGVEDIKALIEQVQVPPTSGRYRVFIVDEVHMLSSAAFNAFLKTLEEPPEYVVFILATTEKHKIIPTILSRCQIYDFSRITIQDMVEHLSSVAAKEGIEAEASALNVIARKADGAMRDALSIFDQVAASSMGHVTFQNTIDNLNILDSRYYSRLVEAFLAGNIPDALLIYKEVRDKGFDSQFFINGLGLYMRDLMLAYTPQTLSMLEGTDDDRTQMAALAAKCPPPFIYRAMSLCNDADLNFRAATNKQFLIELTLVKLCQLCSPSPSRGDGEGQLKPIFASQPAPTVASAATAPASPAAPQPQRQAAPAQTAPSQAAPQPAPTAAPAQAVPASPAPPAPAPRRVAASPLGGTISIRRAKAGPEKPVEKQAETRRERRSSPYTIEQLTAAWKQSAAEHPAEKILISTMLGSLPQQSEGDIFDVYVDEHIQVSILDQFRSSILETIHNALSNDNIEFRTHIRQGESSPATWTQRQVLAHMLDECPELQKFIDDFSCTLG